MAQTYMVSSGSTTSGSQDCRFDGQSECAELNSPTGRHPAPCSSCGYLRRNLKYHPASHTPGACGSSTQRGCTVQVAGIVLNQTVVLGVRAIRPIEAMQHALFARLRQFEHRSIRENATLPCRTVEIARVVDD